MIYISDLIAAFYSKMRWKGSQSPAWITNEAIQPMRVSGWAHESVHYTSIGWKPFIDVYFLRFSVYSPAVKSLRIVTVFISALRLGLGIF